MSAQTIGGRALSNFPGAVGLPKDVAGKRPVAFAGGSLAGARAGTDALSVRGQLAALGTVLMPGEPLGAGIRRAVAQKGTLGGRLLIPPGVYDVAPDGLAIAAAGVELIALSPGQTFIRRARGDSASTLAIVGALTIKYGALNITGNSIILRGLTFLDALGTAPALLVTGSGVTVDNCTFADVDRAIIGYSSTGLRFTNNTITSARESDAVRIIGTVAGMIVAGNKGDGDIVASGTTITRSSFVGNVLDAGHVITYTGGITGNTHAGNVGLANEEGAYTLADNTAVAASVPGMVSWSTSAVKSVRMTYQISRGATPDIEAGELQLVMNAAECIAYVDAVTTTAGPGVAFSGVVAAGTASLYYTTTATGNAATFTVLSVSYGWA